MSLSHPEVFSSRSGDLAVTTNVVERNAVILVLSYHHSLYPITLSDFLSYIQMTTRRPLGNSIQLPTNISPSKTPRVVSVKRARSPDHQDLTAPRAKLKRARAIPPQEMLLQENEKERRHAEREQQKAEFREKYRRAFPKWSFYFDTENIDLEPGHVAAFELKIQQLGGASRIALIHLQSTHQPISGRKSRISFLDKSAT